jgi:hypothetical protein
VEHVGEEPRREQGLGLDFLRLAMGFRLLQDGGEAFEEIVEYCNGTIENDSPFLSEIAAKSLNAPAGVF